MKRISISFGGIAITTAALLSSVGCSGDDGGGSNEATGGVVATGGIWSGTLGGGSSVVTPAGGTAGVTSTIGATTPGGTTAAGGATTGGGTTGATTVGGTTAVGGSTAAGGTTAVGGSTNAGGTSAVGGSTTAGGTSAVGGSTTAGGTSAVGGSTTAGGTSAATGGTTAATGGTTAATGGTTAATGGTTAATGGTTAATGGTTAATGGTTASTGGTTAISACAAYTGSIAAYCKPTADTIKDLASSTTLGGITFAASGSDILVTSSTAATVGVIVPPTTAYTNTGCVGSGVNATSLASGQAYTGLSVSITNNGAEAVTISLYIQDKTTAGKELVRKYTLTGVPADDTAHTYNVVWADGTDLCTLGSGDSFSQTTILGIGFGVDPSTPASLLDLTISDVTFVAPPVAATPCTGICTITPTVFTKTSGVNYNSGNLGTGVVCRETTSEFNAGGWGNFVSPRVLSLNGTALAAGSIPASSSVTKRNGGYCFTTSAGDFSYAYFNLW